MKTYAELSAAEQTKARNACLDRLLKCIVEGLRFNDALNGDDLQARIDLAVSKAESMQTPWFAGEYILDTCREDLEAMAICNAEDALYPSINETIISGIAS